MLIYKLRSLNALLNEYHELERQEIYFASYDELNDPLEGAADIFWHGDIIVWKSFFRHYLLCLDKRFIQAQLYKPEDYDEFFKTRIDVFITEECYINRMSEVGKERWIKIKERFFADELLSSTYLIEKHPSAQTHFCFYLS